MRSLLLLPLLVCVSCTLTEPRASFSVASLVSVPHSTGPALGPLSPAVDRDRDGLADADEERIARRYLPYLSIDPRDRCPRAGIVYRITPHPRARDMLHMVVVSLFERDCGASSHLGDNEVFGVTIDPSLPAPEGIIAIRAIAHQNTLCQHVSQCGRCPQMTPCREALRDGRAYPVVFFSRNKHGAYTDRSQCDGACFFTNWCRLNEHAARPPMANAGEPHAPLIRDLTTGAWLQRAAGWREPALLHYDPWGKSDFGGAGSVAEDLVDEAFVAPACRLPRQGATTAAASSRATVD